MRVNLIILMAAVLAVLVSVGTSARAQDEDLQIGVADATSKIAPSVVAIETRFDKPRLDTGYDYWQYMRGARPLYGLWGSGFVYKDPQYVITAGFLLDYAEYIRVILPDGRSYSAELVGRDSDFDVAVLEVDYGPDPTPPAPVFGNSDRLNLGQPIAIVGKALHSIDTFATAGVISAIRKNIPRSEEPTDQFLQFDASYEMSFIGGPLIDTDGRVVAMVEGTVGQNLNLGTPINDLVRVADEIIAGEVTDIWFGVEAIMVRRGIIDQGWAPERYDWNRDGVAEEIESGYWVSYVEEGSPADIAGLEERDLIMELDDVFIKYDYDWDSYIRTWDVGQLVTVKFLRFNDETQKWERQQTQVTILEDPEAADEEDEDDDNGNGGMSSPHGH
jgi:serine protease Do